MTLEDIEDIGTWGSNNGEGSRADLREFRIRVKPRYRKEDLEHRNDNDYLGVYQNFLPGKHPIYVRTWGCTHNNSDSEYMMGLLAESGYPIVDSPEEASVWILNSCTVKNPAEDQFRNEIKNALDNGKKLVVAGCVSQSDWRASYLKNISIIGVQQIDRVVEVVEETLKGNVVRYLSIRKEGGKRTGGASLHMPKIRRNPLVEIIPISTGCLNECTYCKTKHARGKLASYPIEDIVYRAITAFKEGVKELWITSEDTGAYGYDLGTSLPQLLFRLIDVTPDDCMLRIGMTNPPYIYDFIEQMAKILSHPRVYSFLHIPVQSGSDLVLEAMKREYTVSQFQHIVDYLQEKVPGITIATDIICGFPTETLQDFNLTIDLIDEYKFPVLFINKFYPRPGTPAAKMKRLKNFEVKRRSRWATEKFNSYQPYENRIGKRYRILITEISTDGRFFVGHNKFYEHILVEKDKCQLGDWKEVEIIDQSKHYMIGKVLNENFLKRFIFNRTAMGRILITVSLTMLVTSVGFKFYRSLT